MARAPLPRPARRRLPAQGSLAVPRQLLADLDVRVARVPPDVARRLLHFFGEPVREARIVEAVGVLLARVRASINVCGRHQPSLPLSTVPASRRSSSAFGTLN